MDSQRELPESDVAPVSGWAYRPAVLIGALVFVWPVGMSLLMRSRWPRGWNKALLAVLTLPVFVLAVALAIWLSPWRMSPKIPLRDHERDLAAERAAQLSGAAPLPPWTAIDSRRAWPAFRGPRRDGVVEGFDRPLDWPEGGPPVRWKRRVGSGLGSFAIANGRAYTLELQGDDEVVLCLALSDGRVVWSHRYPARFEMQGAGPGPRSTPTLDGQCVYTLGATGVLLALDAVSGERLWKRDVLRDAGAKNITWGVANSPLVDGGKVIVVAGGRGASLVAYDAATGDPAWQVGDAPASYASPVRWRLAGVDQILSFDAAGLTAYAADGSRPLWHFPWKTNWEVNAAQPIPIGENRVLVSSGYDHGAAVIELRNDAGRIAPSEVWANRNLRVKYTGAVLHQGFVYGPDEQIFACIDPANGQRRWRGGRYGYCFPLLVGGQIVIACENGDVALLDANPEEHREIVRFPVLDGHVMNYPAIGEGVLLLRNDRHMACLDLEGPSPAAVAALREASR